MTFNSVISKRANISVWSALIASQKAKLVSLVFRKKDWLNTAREDEGMSLGYQRKLNESHNGIKHLAVWDVEQRDVTSTDVIELRAWIRSPDGAKPIMSHLMQSVKVHDWRWFYMQVNWNVLRTKLVWQRRAD